MEEKKKLTVGVAMIAKNEKDMIGRALDSAKGADQIVVCDTGSTDNGETVRVAREHGATVFEDYKWEDSFCKARNHVKSKMTTDWILSLDCDEFIHDFSKVRQAAEFAESKGIRAVDILQIAEDTSNQKNTFPRLFRNDPDIIWHGAAHNYISVLGIFIMDTENGLALGDPGNKEHKEKATVRLTYGYSPAHLTDLDRTLRILEKAVETGSGAREIFYLGREYWYRQWYEKCTAMLGQYVQKSVFLQEKAEAFLIMSHCYWRLGRGEDARDAILQAIKINPNFKEAVLFMADLSGKGSGNPVWEKNAQQWLKMAETADNSHVLFERTQ